MDGPAGDERGWKGVRVLGREDEMVPGRKVERMKVCETY